MHLLQQRINPMSAFNPAIGAAGITYRSEAEAAISFPLYNLGIVSHDDYYPQSFTDDDGASFNAMSDFFCPLTGIFFEFKNGYLNGLKSKANADRAILAFNKAKASGYINKRNEALKTLMAAWSASVPKFRMVQEQTAAAGGVVVMVFDCLPDADTVGRLTRAKVFWCVFGDEAWRAFISFRTLAKNGFRSIYTIKGHQFTSHGGILLH
jgi:hypothetical protein